MLLKSQDRIFRGVREALARRSVDEAARIVLSLVADHPMRLELVARFAHWDGVIRESEEAVGCADFGDVHRVQGDDLLKGFVNSMIAEVWKI